jgi:hypothetical protein
MGYCTLPFESGVKKAENNILLLFLGIVKFLLAKCLLI